MYVNLWKVDLNEAREDFRLYSEDEDYYDKNLRRPIFHSPRKVKLELSYGEIAGFVVTQNFLLQIQIDEDYNAGKNFLEEYNEDELKNLVAISPLGREPRNPWSDSGPFGIYEVDIILDDNRVSRENYEEYVKILDDNSDYFVRSDKLKKLREPYKSKGLRSMLKFGFHQLFHEFGDVIRGIDTYYQFVGIHSQYYGSPINFSFRINGKFFKGPMELVL